MGVYFWVYNPPCLKHFKQSVLMKGLKQDRKWPIIVFFLCKNLDNIISGPQRTVQNNLKKQFMTPLMFVLNHLEAHLEVFWGPLVENHCSKRSDSNNHIMWFSWSAGMWWTYEMRSKVPSLCVGFKLYCNWAHIMQYSLYFIFILLIQCYI